MPVGSEKLKPTVAAGAGEASLVAPAAAPKEKSEVGGGKAKGRVANQPEVDETSAISGN